MHLRGFRLKVQVLGSKIIAMNFLEYGLGFEVLSHGLGFRRMGMLRFYNKRSFC